MATAPTGGGGTSPAQTSGYAQFATYVAHATGLELPVVQAWVLAEGGPLTNPLNIGPGRNYGTWQGAAQATVQLLRTNKSYTPILAAARQGDHNTQLDAITNSPWDAGHYAGSSGKPGTLLRGTFQRVQSGGGDIFGSIGSVASGAVGAVASVPGAVGDALTGWVGDLTGWIEGKAVTGLAYVALTGLALALIVLGLERSTGALSALARLARPGASEIPF